MTEQVKPATCDWCGRYITRHMDAYYYGFSATGVREVDNILCSVASAGKGCHNTEDWNEHRYPELIQKAAAEAAASINALREAHDHAQEGLRNARKQEQEMRANIAESLQALGLLSTLAGDVVVDPNNLMSMAQEIVKSVNAKIAAMQAEPNRQTILRMSAENASLRERLQVVAQMRDGMKGAVRIKPLVWEEDLADPRLLGEGCCYYVADGTLWFFDPSIHRIKAKLGVQVHLEGRTISDAAQADYEARLIASGVVEPVEVPR